MHKEVVDQIHHKEQDEVATGLTVQDWYQEIFPDPDEDEDDDELYHPDQDDNSDDDDYDDNDSDEDEDDDPDNGQGMPANDPMIPVCQLPHPMWRTRSHYQY